MGFILVQIILQIKFIYCTKWVHRVRKGVMDKMIFFRNVQATDLEQLLLIENEGFSMEEAATKEAFVERIQLIADTFIVAEKEEEILGYINGPIINQPYITDNLFEEIKDNSVKRGGYQSVLGLAVSNQAKKSRNCKEFN